MSQYKKEVANLSLDDLPIGLAKKLGVANFLRSNFSIGLANMLGGP